MSYCRRCRTKRPCACTPYNAIRERGEPGDPGVNATIPTWTVVVAEGPIEVEIGGTLTDPILTYHQPAPDFSLQYTWLGTNTFTGGIEFQGSLTVESGDNTNPGEFLPGSTVTTTITTGSTVFSGTVLFNNVDYTVQTIASDGFAYFSGPTSFTNLTVNGPLEFTGDAHFGTVTLTVAQLPVSIITGSSRIAFECFLDSCGMTRSGNEGVIAQQLKLTPSWPFPTNPVPGDGDEHVLFSTSINFGAPACGPDQTAAADLLALIDVLAQATTFGDKWTIRMRLDDPDTGDILDAVSFYTLVTGGFASWPDTRLLLRNIAAPVATGVNAIYFTAQSDNSGVDDLTVSTDAPKLTVQ